jgi:hypothetical protein
VLSPSFSFIRGIGATPSPAGSAAMSDHLSDNCEVMETL